MLVPRFLKDVWRWVLAHLAFFSVTTTLALGTAAISFRGWLLKRKLLHCSRLLRARADRTRFYTDNTALQFSLKDLRGYLGKDGKYIGDILEFMEEKGWAKKIRGSIGLWEIN